MPDEIKINLNDFIKVKLTETGKEIFNHRFDDLNEKTWKRSL